MKTFKKSHNLIRLIAMFFFVFLEVSLSSNNVKFIEKKIHSGIFNGKNSHVNPTEPAFETQIDIPNAPWIRVKFEQANLGIGSYILAIYYLKEANTK